MQNRKTFLKILMTLTGLITLLWLGTLTGVRSVSAQTSRPVQDNDTTRAELAQFDRFLDGHPEIAEQLHKDPALVNNREFVEKHPALQTFLQQQPGVREEIRGNPNAFMRQENNFDRREDARDQTTNRGTQARFDQFLDGHREIAEQLRRDPNLVNNRDFVAKHPELQTFLQEQPDVRNQIRENPNAFMRQENNFDRREDARDQTTNRGTQARFDQFLDSHREIAEQLRRDPNLVNNRDFVAKHPELQTFLQEQPGIRNQIRENPDAFMRRENNFDRREDARDQGDRREGQAHFDRFLDSHREIADQLHKDPTLVNNREFVDKHPELQTFLQQEQPEVRNQIRENPNSFVRQENNFGRPAEVHDRDAMRGQPTAEGRDRDMTRGQSTAQGHDQDMTRGQSNSFKDFLGSHSTISQQLSKDPSLVKNPEYLQNHPELQDYLKSHPGAQDDFMKNPQQTTVKPTTQPGTTAGTPVKSPDPVKAPTPDAKPKQ